MLAFPVMSEHCEEFQLEYSYYFDTNVNERVKVHNGIKENESAFFVSNDIYEEMSNTSDYFYIDLNSGIEEDINFNIFITRYETYYFNNSDGTGEADVEIENNSKIYSFNYTHGHEHEINDTIYGFICAEMEALDDPVNARIYGGVEQNDSTIEWYKSDPFQVSGDQTYCETLIRQVNESELNGTIQNIYVGVSCEDCVSGTPSVQQRLSLKLDESGSSNYSNYVFDNENDTTPTETADDYVISSTVSDHMNDCVLENTLRFRDPFNVTLKFFRGNDTYTEEAETYDNEFQIVVLRDKSITTETDGVINFFESFNNLFYGRFLTENVEIDSKLSFWDYYDKDTGATIKLYEKSNYSINLVSSRAINYNQDNWDYEFIYPQYSGDNYYGKVADIQLNHENNTGFNVYIDMFEISKFQVIMNIGKVILIFILWIGLTVAISMLNSRAGATVAAVTLPIALKFMGLY